MKECPRYERFAEGTVGEGVRLMVMGRMFASKKE